jgi:hypothetical protein
MTAQRSKGRHQGGTIDVFYRNILHNVYKYYTDYDSLLRVRAFYRELSKEKGESDIPLTLKHPFSEEQVEFSQPILDPMTPLTVGAACQQSVSISWYR